VRGLAILFLLAAPLVASGQTAVRETSLLKWKNIAPAYRKFSEIKPVLVNQESAPIFLSRLWPDGSAQLERYNESTHEWEPGDWGITCGVVRDPTLPIEIKAGSEYEVDVYWQLSSDDWKKPKHFVVYETLEKRPLTGKYKFILRYALKPWTTVHHPGAIYVIESQEFMVKQ